MKKILLTIFLFTSFFCHAQNYQCVQSGVKHYFTNSNGYLRGIRIDSIASGPDSTIYYPYHTPRGYYSSLGSGSALDSNGGSWLGKNVVKRSDGTFIFDNLWKDSIVIKTQAGIGDSWIFYHDTTTLYYLASLISEDTLSVLGAIDSVKTILITAHNPAGMVASDPADSFQIVLSKNNGLVKVFDLYTFPYHAPDSAYRQGLDYYLDYVLSFSSTPTQANSVFSLIALVNPSFQDLYGWNVGDVYEYSSCNDYFEHYGSSCYPVEFYYFDTVTSVSTSTATTSYNFNSLTSTYIAPWPVNPLSLPIGPFVYSNGESSGALHCDSSLLIDTLKMPEEYGNANLYSIVPNDTSYCITGTLYTILGFGHGYISGADYYTIFENFSGPTNYKYPLGLLNDYSSYEGSAGSDVNSQNLIYYEHDGHSCGNRYILPTSVTNISAPNNKITISPNPTTSELNISSSDKIYYITITNLLGQTIYSNQYSSSNVEVNVADIPAGLYFVKVNGSYVQKFVKQ
jgi:hypothetical protein